MKPGFAAAGDGPVPRDVPGGSAGGAQAEILARGRQPGSTPGSLGSWAGRRLRLAVRTVIRAVRMANDQQVSMWECVLLTSGVVPLTAAGPLRWVPSLDGHRLIGSHLPAQDPGETGR